MSLAYAELSSIFQGDSQCGWVGYLIVFLILACTLPLFIVPLFYMGECNDEHNYRCTKDEYTHAKDA